MRSCFGKAVPRGSSSPILRQSVCHMAFVSILFDRLVGAAEQCQWPREAEGLGSLDIDEQLHPSNLLDRQIEWLVAFEDASRLNAGLPVRLRKTASVTHQAAGRYKVAGLMNCWDRVP